VRSPAKCIIAALLGAGAGCAAPPDRRAAVPPTPGVAEALAPLPAPSVVRGASVKGTALTMHVFGSGPDVTLIFAAIHGDEPAAAFVGRKLMEHLQQQPESVAGGTVAIIPLVNPDGLAAGTRTNANGVDCNRNFPASNWKHRPGFLRSNPGTRPASDPETLAVM
jgi:protein MpaA